MGAWDMDSFDNDTACDWAFDLEDSEDLQFVIKTLDEIPLNSDEEVDADDACCAIAACEAIARLKGNWGRRDAHSEPVDKWVEAHPTQPGEELISKATAVLDRILGDNSELRDLWEETEHYGVWRASVENLRNRTAS